MRTIRAALSSRNPFTAVPNAHLRRRHQSGTLLTVAGPSSFAS